MQDVNKSECEQYEALPLKRTWNMWFDSPQFHKSYEDYLNPHLWVKNLHYVYSIDSIQTFWQVYNNVMSPSEMWYKSAYHLFAVDSISAIDYSGQILISFTMFDEADQNGAWLYGVLLILGECAPYSHKVHSLSIIKHKKSSEMILRVYDHNSELVKPVVDYVFEFFQKKGITLQINYFTLNACAQQIV